MDEMYEYYRWREKRVKELNAMDEEKMTDDEWKELQRLEWEIEDDELRQMEATR